MTTSKMMEIFQLEDILDLPEKLTTILDGDIEKRNEIYRLLIEANNYDVSYDWFQETYEEEFAQRAKGKQDFTPNTVSLIASKLTGQKEGFIYEPTAGNGGMIITDWWQRCLNSAYPLLHFPSENIVVCWELSNRSLPLLLFNLSIRGMMGYVFHGNVLSQEFKMKYILVNKKNDTLGFSDILKDPENKNWIYGETLFQEGKIYKPFKNIY